MTNWRLWIRLVYGKWSLTCGDCGDFENLEDCKKLNNFISKIFAFIFRSDRIGNLNRIREIGVERFKEEKQT